MSASRADDSAADDDDTTGLSVHTRIPMQNGSLGSSNRVASAQTYAEPVMRGITLPPSTRTEPAKTLPIMLSCRQICPSTQLAIGEEAGELGAGAGAARRAVVSLAGTEDEVAPVVRRVERRSEQLDMIDFFSVISGNSLPDQRLPHTPGCSW